MKIRIGPHRIADAAGTHEPGEEIANPSQALIDLALAKATDENGRAYVEVVADVKPAEPVAPVAPAAPAAPADTAPKGNL